MELIFVSGVVVVTGHVSADSDDESGCDGNGEIQ